MMSLPYLFEFWASHAQQPARKHWTTWLMIGGRGAGKTRAGAEWVRQQVEGATPLAAGKKRHLALIGETLDQTREVMVYGDSGIMAISPPDRRPSYHAARRRLIWPNGAEAALFSASDPESLRGPQFDGAWCDELGKWRKAQDAWDMLQFGLRLGAVPQQVITTTPRANETLLAIYQDPETLITQAPTQDNAVWLADGFIRRLQARYTGPLATQELEGQFVLETPNALWSRALLAACQAVAPECFDRIVVAIDPPVSSGKQADYCGIIVAGVVFGQGEDKAQAYILADRSCQGQSPTAWAAQAIAAYHEFEADRLVAEINQGGEMVETILRQIDNNLSFQSVRAHHRKTVRAEPVAALYEQGRVWHCGALSELEAQMCAFTHQGLANGRSPDRVDALVWAVRSLLLDPAVQPRIRSL